MLIVQSLYKIKAALVLYCTSMQRITDVTLWFPVEALKYSKFTKATVEFRTNTGGMFSYLFL